MFQLQLPKELCDEIDLSGQTGFTTNICSTMRLNACDRGLAADKMDYWRDFLRIVNRTSDLGCTRDSSPRIGDLIYGILFLIELGVTETVDDNERPRDKVSNNPVLRDFFLLSVTDFVSKHLEMLSSLTTPDERQRLFSLKSWITCRVHTDVRLLEVASTTNLVASDVELQESLNGRICFFDRNSIPRRTCDDARLVGIDSFSPTLAVYTFCNLRDVYASTAFSDTERFDDRSLEVNQTNSNHLSKKRKRSRGNPNFTALTVVGRPPTKKNWFSLCRGSNVNADSEEWPKQTLLVDVGGSIYRDKKLFRYIDRAITSENVSLNSGEETINNVRAFVRPEEYERIWKNEQFNEISRHATFPRFLELLDGISVAWAKLNVFESDIFC